MIIKKFVIKNKVGLHARPAAVFVQTASKFESRITLSAHGKKANAKSIVEVLSLGVEEGAEVTIAVDGRDEKDAMKAIEKLMNSDFGE